jgi:ketosteroid isomerase-like protein
MTRDEMAAVIDRLGDAFASGDPQLVLAEFAPDDEVMYAGSEPGEIAVGRAALRALLADLFERDERYRWRCSPPHVVETAHGAFVVADATLAVHGVNEDGAATDGSTDSLPYRITGLLELWDGAWRWRCWQGSEPGPLA